MAYIVGDLLQGFSCNGWKHQHNVHHAATNVVGRDGDIDLMPFWATVASDLKVSRSSSFAIVVIVIVIFIFSAFGCYLLGYADASLSTHLLDLLHALFEVELVVTVNSLRSLHGYKLLWCESRFWIYVILMLMILWYHFRYTERTPNTNKLLWVCTGPLFFSSFTVYRTSKPWSPTSWSLNCLEDSCLLMLLPSIITLQTNLHVSHKKFCLFILLL